jgi:hypothetical protein
MRLAAAILVAAAGAGLPNARSPPAGGGGARLASIARELAFNDPQAETGEDGSDDRRGTPLDRNVELLVRRPY